MDTLTIIILTAVINALVTGTIGGIVLYRIQKKIDNSYFEQQTKFVRNHEKRTEYLETLYHKARAFTNNYLEVLRNIDPELSSKKVEQATYENYYEKLSLDAEDFLNYYMNNRLVLTETEIKEMQKIYSNVQMLMLLLPNADILLEIPTNILSVWNTLIIASHLEMHKIDLKKPDSKLFFKELRKEAHNQAVKIENLYKSVANITTRH